VKSAISSQVGVLARSSEELFPILSRQDAERSSFALPLSTNLLRMITTSRDYAGAGQEGYTNFEHEKVVGMFLANFCLWNVLCKIILAINRPCHKRPLRPVWCFATTSKFTYKRLCILYSLQ